MSGKTALAVFLVSVLSAPGALAGDAEEGAHGGSAMVVLSWDESGQFGPQTPGTKTAGWQEAIDYCVEHGQDLYAKGGWGGRKAIYHVQDTIRIPATQDFRIDGGVYVINWEGPADDPAKDLMIIDSSMNCEYHFGIFVYGGAGAALRIRPEHPVPIDGFPVVVETEIKSQGLADPQPFVRGERRAGTGLVLDATRAGITCSRFDFVGGILNFQTCVAAMGSFRQNHFSCLHLHTNADKSTLLTLGPGCSQNVVEVAIGVDMGAEDVRGIVVEGSNNTFQMMTRGSFPRGNDLILEGAAAGNRIDVIHGKDAFDPADFLTDKADKATNRLTWVGGRVPLYTVEGSSGTWVYTQRLYPACVRLVGGDVLGMKLVRGEDSVDCYESCRADILMDVGDELHVMSTEAPALQVRAIGGR